MRGSHEGGSHDVTLWVVSGGSNVSSISEGSMGDNIQRTAIITACAAIATLSGCSDPSSSKNTFQELAACRFKSMELYRSSAEDFYSSVSPAMRYIDACMEAKGYSGTSKCAADPARSFLSGCWTLMSP